MKASDFSSFYTLMGCTKKEVIAIMGNRQDVFEEDHWVYLLEKTWYGKRRFLVLEFYQNTVTTQYTMSTFTQHY